MAINPTVERGKNGSKSLQAIVDDIVQLDSFTVATAPAAAAHARKVIYVTDGAAGSPCLAVSNGTSWMRVLIGAAIAAE
jgi:hypothetical protein